MYLRFFFQVDSYIVPLKESIHCFDVQCWPRLDGAHKGPHLSSYLLYFPTFLSIFKDGENLIRLTWLAFNFF